MRRILKCSNYPMVEVDPDRVGSAKVGVMCLVVLGNKLRDPQDRPSNDAIPDRRDRRQRSGREHEVLQGLVHTRSIR